MMDTRRDAPYRSILLQYRYNQAYHRGTARQYNGNLEADWFWVRWARQNGGELMQVPTCEVELIPVPGIS
jgi:hypothetical protein